MKQYNELDAVSARSRNMAAVKSKNTRPELIVRRLCHSMGYRFRLHRKDLPGSPDLVFPSRKKVIFVHGCFWHRHKGCRRATVPNTRREFWLDKFEKNQERDKKVAAELQRRSWEIEVVWECDIKDVDALRDRLADFLD